MKTTLRCALLVAALTVSTFASVTAVKPEEVGLSSAQLKKIEGQRQLEEMEMRNKKTGSHSWVKYNLE